MTSNVVTLPGKAPPVREVPEFKPKLTGDETEQDQADTTFSNALFIENAIGQMMESEPLANVERFLIQLLDSVEAAKKKAASK